MTMRIIFFLFILIFPTLTWCSNTQLLVEITGLEKDDKAAVLSCLSIKNVEKDKELNQEQIYSFYELGRDEITTALETLGYYHSKVASELKRSKQDFLAEYHITLGPAVIIKNIDLKLIGDGKKNNDLLRIKIKSFSLKLKRNN